MRPETIVNLFSGLDGQMESMEYLKDQGLLDSVRSIERQSAHRILPDYRDLARLHSVVRSRRVFTILEFGIGYSTLVMADALAKNQAYWDALNSKPDLRNCTPFQLHSVDTEREWIELAVADMPKHLASFVKTHHAGVIAGDFGGRDCHFYEKLPNVVPDFIYLDGPDPAAVAHAGGGQQSQWCNKDKVVMAADLLRIEPLLLPGTVIVVDGRSANARFLRSHFYRNWAACYNAEGDITAFELQEAPLGLANSSAMRYCLGSMVSDWESIIPLPVQAPKLVNKA